MGAAGLTSSSVEMASKGNLGIEINLDKVPCRESNMTPYEMMLSESQERMLLIIKSGKENIAEKIFKKWDLDFAIIGKTTKSKHLVLNFKEELVADIPLTALSTDVPIYSRNWKKNVLPKKEKNKIDLNNIKVLDSLKKILSSPNNSNKKWVWEQYDTTVMGDTIQKPGGDASIVRIHGKNKGIAATIDSSSHYCFAYPLSGGKQVVCEAWRNLISVGSEPIAITNCLNFGNPEKEIVMGQFVECLDGISQACTYLDFPIVSGNVSFYNETNNRSIEPTPAIGGVGLIKNLNNIVSQSLKEVNSLIIVIGKTTGHLHQSEFFREVINVHDGPPPEINLFNEKNNGLSLQNLIAKKLIKSAHDISSGGILVTLTEMCLSGNIGAKIKSPNGSINKNEYLFGEDQSRYLIEISEKDKNAVSNILKENDVFFEIIAKTQKDKLELNNDFSIHINDLKEINNNWFYNYNRLQ